MSQQTSERPWWQRETLLWAAAALVIVIVYWACLRLQFPGYFAPISPFDSDFYGYTGIRSVPFDWLVSRYPRPVSYLAMKLLGSSGLRGLIAGGIAIALVNILLTVFLIRRLCGFSNRGLVVGTAFYASLLFAHPEFYFEHRHDLPAEVSYLFAVLCLIFWQAYTTKRRSILLVLSLAAAVLFAFAKETYFVSMLCLVLGLAAVDKPARKLHAAFLVVLAAIEATSFFWNKHLNGPFVNTNAAADSTYRIDLAPASVLKSYRFYLDHLFNPVLLLLVIVSLILLWRSRRLLGISLAFATAGIATFATHAVLPNHQFEEYAWAGAAFALAPVFILTQKLPELSFNRFVLIGLGILWIFALRGPLGYYPKYQTDALRWMVNQDKVARNLAKSFPALQAIPPSRVLIAGLETAYFPWQEENYMRQEFHPKVSWTILAGPDIELRRTYPAAHIATADEVQLDSFDQLVTYERDGRLRSIRKIAEIPAAEREKPLLMLIPGLASAAAKSDAHPKEVYDQFIAAGLCIDWKLWPEAQSYMAKASQAGGASDPTFRQLSTSLANGMKNWQPVVLAVGTLMAKPAHIVQPDGSGVGKTEIFWTISPQHACEVHVNAPDGAMFAAAGVSGNSMTEKWVQDGTEFFLQDVTGGKPLTSANTLARVKISVTSQ